MIEPMTPARADDLVDFWRRHGFDEAKPGEGLAAATDAEEEAAWIRTALDSGHECGRLIVDDGAVIAYAKYGSPALFGARAGGIASRASADAVLLAGLCVAADVRDRGLSKLLLSAVERDLHKRGLQALEAFASAASPEGPTAARSVEFYERNGFRVKGRDPVLPLLRLELKSVVSWTENLDALLDALLAAGAAAMPRRAPAATGP